MKKITLLILFFSTIIHAQDTGWVWAKTFEDISNAAITSSFIDNQKNSYHIGTFSGATLTIGETVINNSSDFLGNPTIGYQDTYITKHDPEGNVQVLKHFSGSKFEAITSIAYDNNAHFYITGHFNGDMTIGTNTYQTPNNETKSFIAKLDLNGNVIWSKQINYNGSALLKYKDNYLYLAGTYTGNTFTLDNITAPSVGYTAVVTYMDKTFVAKLDLNGNAIWLKSSTYNGSATIEEPHRIGTQPRGLAVDNLGNVYVAGMFFCRATSFGSINLTKSVTTNNANLFIAKYDSTGNVSWASTAATNSSAHSIVTDLATDSNNNVYLIGQVYRSTVNFGGTTLNFPGNYGSYLVKYATAGNVLWAKAAKIATDAQPSTGIGTNFFSRMFIDNSNNIHVTGIFTSYINFGNNFFIQNDNYNTNLFSVKFDTNGTASDFYKLTEAENSREIKILDISADQNVMYFSGKTSNPTFTLGNITLANPNGKSLTYIAKRDKTLSIEEHSGKGFTVYPNPSQDQLYISGLDAAEAMHFTVFDLTGKRIKSIEPANTDTTAIDVKDLDLGTYVLKIENGTTQKNIKFIKS